MKKNIVLIGMPGAGKSSIGVVLAKSLGYRFIDSDIVIQEKEGKRLFEIIREVGMDGFIEVENRINAEIETEHSVIATGGSVIYGEEAMQHLKEIGTVIYIKVSYRTLRRRLGDLSKRGVAIKKGYTLKDLYDERTPLYEKYADITLDINGMNIRAAQDLICKAVRK